MGRGTVVATGLVDSTLTISKVQLFICNSGLKTLQHCIKNSQIRAILGYGSIHINPGGSLSESLSFPKCPSLKYTTVGHLVDLLLAQ